MDIGRTVSPGSISAQSELGNEQEFATHGIQCQVAFPFRILKDPESQQLLNHFIGHLSVIDILNTDQDKKALSDTADLYSVDGNLRMGHPLYQKTHVRSSAVIFCFNA
jgi:hypothetical protein